MSEAIWLGLIAALGGGVTLWSVQWLATILQRHNGEGKSSVLTLADLRSHISACPNMGRIEAKLDAMSARFGSVEGRLVQIEKNQMQHLQFHAEDR